MNLSNIPQIHPGNIVYVTGPSGSGKSQALPIILERIPIADDQAVPSIDTTKPLIDGWDVPPKVAIARLSAVGLGDPVTWCRLPSELSIGQAQRLMLADLLAHPAPLIVFDEFLAGLDRITAKAVAWTSQRAIRKAGKTAVFLTANDDLEADLAPDITIKCNWSPDPDYVFATDIPPRSTIDSELIYTPGITQDWLALKSLHYAAGNPATIDSVHCLRHPDHDDPVAVMVLSYCDLHSAARNLGTRQRYTMQSPTENARRLNREVRRMSRIVVTPELRQIGLASRLIQEVASVSTLRYLETSTAMGPFTSFCERAGFQPIPQERSRPEAAWVGFTLVNSLPATDALSSPALLAWVDSLSVRKRRQGRQLIWALYHHLVLHRKTRKTAPKRIPPDTDPQWGEALNIAATRAITRPVYYLMPLKQHLGD